MCIRDRCGKLKCCLNYELSGYRDAQKGFPETIKPLKTAAGEAFHQKTDVYRRIMWYGYEGAGSQVMIPVSVERVAEIQEMNRKGQVPDELIDKESVQVKDLSEYRSGAGQESLTRFEKTGPRKNKRRKKSYRNQR